MICLSDDQSDWPEPEEPRRKRLDGCVTGMCGCLDCETCNPGCTEILAAEEAEERDAEEQP